MKNKKPSPVAAIVLAVVIGLLVIALLNGVIRPTQVVTAKVAIAAGTILTEELVEIRTIPTGAKPAGALSDLAAVSGKTLAVSRAPGDFITGAVLGESAGAGIPAELEAGHVAMAIRVDSTTGVAGLLRAGQTVSVIGMLSPDVLEMEELTAVQMPAGELVPTEDAFLPLSSGTPTPTPTPAPPKAPLARMMVSGLRVIMVPQAFRYEELPAGASEAQLFSSARTSMASSEGAVIVLDVPTTLVEIAPGYRVDPPALLAALDAYGVLYLVLEPEGGLGLDVVDALTVNLGELYQEINSAE